MQIFTKNYLQKISQNFFQKFYDLILVYMSKIFILLSNNIKYMKKIILISLLAILFLDCSKNKPNNTPTDTSIPNAPTNLNFTITPEQKDPYQEARLYLTWNDNSSNEKVFRVECKYQRRDVIGAGGWVIRCKCLQNDYNTEIVTYFTAKMFVYYDADQYRVAAYNDAGISSYSNIITVKPNYP